MPHHAARFLTVVLGLLLGPACNPGAPAGDDPTRGGAGKADLTGSCEASDCNGPSPSGSCWCDDLCVDFGDCCDDRAELCAPVEPTWSLATIASAGNIGEAPALAIGADGTPVVSYYDFDNEGAAVWTAARDGDAWRTERITSAGTLVAARDSGVARDESGVAHLVYRTRAGFRSQLVYRDDTASYGTILDDVPSSSNTGEHRGLQPSIALAPDGALHVASHRDRFDSESSRFVVTVLHHLRVDGAWQSETVAEVSTGLPGWFRLSEIALDDDGRPHLAYRDASTGALFHAVRDDAGWSVTEVAVVDDSTSLRPRLAVDGAKVAIAMTPKDGDARALEVWQRLTDGWDRQRLVDDVIGSQHALAFRGDGVLHAVAATRDGVVLAVPSGGGVVRELVPGAEHGQDPALAFAGSELLVAFFDDVAEDLEVATLR